MYHRFSLARHELSLGGRSFSPVYYFPTHERALLRSSCKGYRACPAPDFHPAPPLHRPNPNFV